MSFRIYTSNYLKGWLLELGFTFLDIDKNRVWIEFSDSDGYKYHIITEHLISQLRKGGDYKLSRFLFVIFLRFIILKDG